MRVRISAAILAVMMSLVASNSWAACQRLGFSVNDYGKKGPIKDAKKALDAYIKKWAEERGITRYHTGKKTVTCELFLDVGFFDEYTCKAAATFCWKGKSNRPKRIKSKKKSALPGKPKKVALAKKAGSAGSTVKKN